jgi:hypothetical protein
MAVAVCEPVLTFVSMVMRYFPEPVIGPLAAPGEGATHSTSKTLVAPANATAIPSAGGLSGGNSILNVSMAGRSKSRFWTCST